MNRSLSLEDFTQVGSAAVEQAPLPLADDTASLDAYEAGYKTGWSDSAAAEAEVRKSVSTDLAQRLREAELTYESAKKDVLASLEPFFEDLVVTLLPRMAAEAVMPLAVQELQQLLQLDRSAEIEIVAAPGSCEAIERLMEHEVTDRAVVRGEAAFSESQISLRVGAERRDIDLSEVTQKITDAIRAFGSKGADPSVTPEPLAKGTV